MFVISWVVQFLAVVFSKAAIGRLAWRLVASLGIGVVTSVGLDLILNKFIDKLASSKSMLSSTIVSALDIFGFDTALAIILAAVSYKILAGTVNGVKSSPVWNPPRTGI